MGKPSKIRSDGLGVSQDKLHNVSICCLALSQPVGLLPRPCVALHLGSPCLAESPYCLGLGRTASTTSLKIANPEVLVLVLKKGLLIVMVICNV